jgi:type III restriction enzyme
LKCSTSIAGSCGSIGPTFLVRLKNGDMLVLETKGQDTEQDRVKRRYLDEWTQAVNAHGGFGRWRSAVAHTPARYGTF